MGMRKSCTDGIWCRGLEDGVELEEQEGVLPLYSRVSTEKDDALVMAEISGTCCVSRFEQ
jgi:hypothetical protein